ncbi:MAG TPA: hypothetical protein VLX68_02165 [Chitinivibrionales bacterium]|nr:hypothetical protein [Chitinivibrionales bacterium]
MRKKFLAFCYPNDVPDNKKEVEIDLQYWGSTTTFLVFSGQEKIEGCVQFIEKKIGGKIPAEFGHVVDSIDGGKEASAVPKGTYSEIYRCRRSRELHGKDSVLVVAMLFKAIWAKVIQTGIEYSYITFDPDNHALRNLYLRKLAFKDPKITLQFGNNAKPWGLLYADWADVDRNLASRGPNSFLLATWIRQGLKQKNPRFPAVKTDLPISEDDAVLFAQVVRPVHTRATAPRNDALPERNPTRSFS